MASKDLTLKLKVDSKSGQAAIKKVADQLKGLETAKGISAASDDMKKLGENAAKAAEEYRKIIDASKADADRLRKSISLKKRAADADIRAIADASKADADRLRKSINAEKQLIAARNKSHNEAIRMEKQRLAAINKTHTFSMRMQKQRIAEINTAYNEAIRMNKQHDKTNALLRNRVGILGNIKKQLFAMRSYWLAISAAVSIAAISVVKLFKSGFNSVEKFRLSVASIAASITTFSDLSKGDVGKVYAEAYKYAEQLALKMEVINVRTIASGEQLRAMNETFIQQGVLLDVNNKKQEDAFVAIANAISLITQGQNQEIQMRQEIRGLLSGDIRATNLLARMIDAKLGGALKENIKIWKEQGTLLENLGKHLEGFKAGSVDLASTWAALSTTFDTIINRYFRSIFKPVYEDIIKNSLIFSRSLLDQKNTLGETGQILKGELLIAWTSTKDIAIGVFNTVDGLKEPLLAVLRLVNQIVKGWALIFKHVTNVALAMKKKFLTEEGVRSWVIPVLKSIGYEGDFIEATPLGEGEEEKPETVKMPTLVTPKVEDISINVDFTGTGSTKKPLTEKLEEILDLYEEIPTEATFHIDATSAITAIDGVIEKTNDVVERLRRQQAEEVYFLRKHATSFAPPPTFLSSVDRQAYLISQEKQKQAIYLELLEQEASSIIPSFSSGTGQEGLPYTGLFLGHKGEIVKSPSESKEERIGGGNKNIFNITFAPTVMTGDRTSMKQAAIVFRDELKSLDHRWN